jgi:DNA-binding response OmpR family regulator
MKNVLIIEDDADIGEAMQALLATEGFTVELATSGEAGLQALERKCEDSTGVGMVIVDLNLPGMSGKEFLLAKRKNRGIAQIPSVIATANDPEMTPEAYPEDVYYVLRKPFEIEELLDAVHEYFRAPLA